MRISMVTRQTHNQQANENICTINQRMPRCLLCFISNAFFTHKKKSTLLFLLLQCLTKKRGLADCMPAWSNLLLLDTQIIKSKSDCYSRNQHQGLSDSEVSLIPDTIKGSAVVIHVGDTIRQQVSNISHFSRITKTTSGMLPPRIWLSL